MKKNRTETEITPNKALELGFTHFVIEDREVIESIEDYDPEYHGHCYLVEPEGQQPQFNAHHLADYLIEYHEELPEVCTESIADFIKSKNDTIQAFVDSLNEEMKSKNIGVFYPGTCYVLIPEPTDL